MSLDKHNIVQTISKTRSPLLREYLTWQILHAGKEEEADSIRLSTAVLQEQAQEEEVVF